MKTLAYVMTLSLAGMLATQAHGAEVFPAFPGDLKVGAAPAKLQVAWLTPAERQMLREQWSTLPPEERERLREKLRAERGDTLEDGFGQGFETRRREVDDDPPRDRDGPGNWGRPRPDDRPRDLPRKRR
jgi:hypothetical protein